MKDVHAAPAAALIFFHVAASCFHIALGTDSCSSSSSIAKKARRGHAMLQVWRSETAHAVDIEKEVILDEHLEVVGSCGYRVFYGAWVASFDEKEYLTTGDGSGSRCLDACCKDPHCLGIAAESTLGSQCYRYSRFPEELQQVVSKAKPLSNAAWLKARPAKWSVFMKASTIEVLEAGTAGGVDADETISAVGQIESHVTSGNVLEREPDGLTPPVEEELAPALHNMMQSLSAKLQLVGARETAQMAMLASGLLAVVRVVTSSAIMFKFRGQKGSRGDASGESGRLSKSYKNPSEELDAVLAGLPAYPTDAALGTAGAGNAMFLPVYTRAPPGKEQDEASG